MKENYDMQCALNKAEYDEAEYYRRTDAAGIDRAVARDFRNDVMQRLNDGGDWRGIVTILIYGPVIAFIGWLVWFVHHRIMYLAQLWNIGG